MNVRQFVQLRQRLDDRIMHQRLDACSNRRRCCSNVLQRGHGQQAIHVVGFAPYGEGELFEAVPKRLVGCSFVKPLRLDERSECTAPRWRVSGVGEPGQQLGRCLQRRPSSSVV